jgi:hypothetical protein
MRSTVKGGKISTFPPSYGGKVDIIFLLANYLKVPFLKWWVGWWDERKSLEKSAVK